MAWLPVPANPNWEYSNAPNTDRKSNDSYNYDGMSNHVSGIRDNGDGTSAYVLCRQIVANVSAPVGYGELPVIPPPVADFSALPLSGAAPLEVVFTDLSSLNASNEWDFDNDGNVDSIEKNPTHIYASPGTYTVKLTAKGSAGQDDMVKIDYITVT